MKEKIFINASIIDPHNSITDEIGGLSLLMIKAKIKAIRKKSVKMELTLPSSRKGNRY